ncbi:MAG: hypothetical protein K2K41_02340 [Ruminiclostridium sp.]|nr:hypothetical protein [Ruminiclostridium sp.]
MTEQLLFFERCSVIEQESLHNLSMSVISTLLFQVFILGTLGCADEEACSFHFLQMRDYKVPAVCKEGVFYFFIRAVSVITVSVQEGAGKEKYRVSTVHGNFYAAAAAYAVGDLWGKLSMAVLILTCSAKKLLFSVLRTLART